jgi:hypothetical protein
MDSGNEGEEEAPLRNARGQIEEEDPET